MGIWSFFTSLLLMLLCFISVLDLNFFTFRSKTNALNISQKMIEMFVRTKHKIDKRHEFALVVINDDALWVSTVNINTWGFHDVKYNEFVSQLSGFTSDPRELCSCLYDLETNVCESFSILSAYSNYLEKVILVDKIVNLIFLCAVLSFTVDF